MQLCSCAVMQAPGKFGKLKEVEVDALRLTTTQHFLQRLIVFVWIRLTKLRQFFTFLVSQVPQKCTKDPDSKASRLAFRLAVLGDHSGFGRFVKQRPQKSQKRYCSLFFNYQTFLFQFN